MGRKSLGQIAFEAWLGVVTKGSADVESFLTWSNLAPESQAAWEAAGSAVAEEQRSVAAAAEDGTK